MVTAAFDTVDDARQAIERLSRAGIGPRTLELQPERGPAPVCGEACIVSIDVDCPHATQQVAELLRLSGARRIRI